MATEIPADELAEAELPYAHKLTADEAFRYLRDEIAPQANREMLAGAARAAVAELTELRAMKQRARQMAEDGPDREAAKHILGEVQ